jgi:hypothetical protein
VQEEVEVKKYSKEPTPKEESQESEESEINSDESAYKEPRSDASSVDSHKVAKMARDVRALDEKASLKEDRSDNLIQILRTSKKMDQMEKKHGSADLFLEDEVPISSLF